jgi:hypothetical protein
MAAELGDDPNPALRSSLAEEALASGSWVRFTVVRCLDRGHRLCKVLAHLYMLVKHMIPRHVVHLDEMALGVPNLSDDIALSDAPRLGAPSDESRLDLPLQSKSRSAQLRENMTVRDSATELSSYGFAQISGPFLTSDEAFDVAAALVEMCRLERGLLPLSVIGDFVVPPLGGTESRDFQTLHFDFGLPLDPKVEGDVARYTALHVSTDVVGVRAVTRLVPLAALLGQRAWPPPAELVERLTTYGRTHGAWDDNQGYVEGSLARIIEAAAAERTPSLPSVKVERGFLCGLEFDSLSSELRFFARHGLRIYDAEIEIHLQPGELLLFDNLAVAHGRRGTRQPGELRQRVFGHHLEPAAQRELRDHALAAFDTRAGR